MIVCSSPSPLVMGMMCEMIENWYIVKWRHASNPRVKSFPLRHINIRRKLNNPSCHSKHAFFSISRDYETTSANERERWMLWRREVVYDVKIWFLKVGLWRLRLSFLSCSVCLWILDEKCVWNVSKSSSANVQKTTYKYLERDLFQIQCLSVWWLKNFWNFWIRSALNT